MDSRLIDAICEILKEAGEPLHYTEIADHLTRRDLWSPNSENPQRYLDSIVCQYIAADPVHARIRRFDWGLYELNVPYVAYPNLAVRGGLLARRLRPQMTLRPVIVGPPNSSSLLIAAITVLQKTEKGRAMWHSDIANRALSLDLVDGDPHELSRQIASELDAEVRRQEAWKDSAPPGSYLVLQNVSHRCYSLVVWHKAESSKSRPPHRPPSDQPAHFGRQSPARLQQRAAKPAGAQAAKVGQPAVSGEAQQTIPAKKAELPRAWNPQLFPDIAERVLRQSARKRPMHLGEIAAKAVELGLMPRLTKPDLKECALQLFLEWIGKGNNTGSGRFMLFGKRRVGLSEWFE